jgi:MT0933-like antitoxin protein
MPGKGELMNFGELGKKAKDFLDSEEGEKKSDAVFDKAAEFLDEKTGGKHAAQIDKGRDFADEHVGRTDGDEHRR